MATAQDIVEGALRKVGNHTPTAEQLANGLETLNNLLGSLSTEKLMVQGVTSETHTLVASTASYTFGTGGDINSTRPNEIVDAFIRDSDNRDYHIDLISQKEYNRITDKTLEGRPYKLFYDNEYTLGKIYLYYTPNAAETLHIDSWKPIVELAALNTTVSLAPEYKKMLVFNLAVDLAPDYNISMNISVYSTAKDTKKKLKSMNKPRPSIRAVDGALSYKGRSNYNINTDNYNG